LAFVPSIPEAGPELLLDTSVYVDVIQGRAPSEVEGLLGLRILNHSSVALAELTHLFGRLDPSHPGTRSTLATLRQAIAMIPSHRLTSPSIRAFAESGMLAGLAARLTGGAHTPAMLNDAVLLLHAMESGRWLLTRNIKHFDHLQQLAPRARILFYRQA